MNPWTSISSLQLADRSFRCSECTRRFLHSFSLTCFLRVLPCDNLLNGIQNIIQHDPRRTNDRMLTEQQAYVLEMIMLQQNPLVMFNSICRYVAKSFDIDLFIVGYHSGEFTLIKSGTAERTHVAYLVFNEDHTVCGPLYRDGPSNVQETFFLSADHSVQWNVTLYIAGLNHRSEFEIKPVNVSVITCDHLGVSAASVPLLVDHLDFCAYSQVQSAVVHSSSLLFLADPNALTSTAGVESVLEKVFGYMGQLSEAVGVDPKRVLVDAPRTPLNFDYERKAAIHFFFSTSRFRERIFFSRKNRCGFASWNCMVVAARSSR